MFGLKGRQDGFRLLFPKEFLVKEVEEKYGEIIKSKIGYFDNPIDFLNETIQTQQLNGKEFASNAEAAGAAGSILLSGRSPGGRHGKFSSVQFSHSVVSDSW